MKCTACNEVVKPVVAIDIDGTLGDYHGHFLLFAEAYLGTERAWTYTGGLKFRDWFTFTYDVDGRTWEDIKLAYRQGAMKRCMPMFHYADTLCAAVRARGAELWLTTTRPYLRLDNVDPDTRAWLNRHGIYFDHMLYDERKYRVLADRVGPERVVAVLDDLPEQIVAAGLAFGPDVPIHRRTKWNRDEAINGGHVINLQEALSAITNRIERWEASNA